MVTFLHLLKAGHWAEVPVSRWGALGPLARAWPSELHLSKADAQEVSLPGCLGTMTVTSLPPAPMTLSLCMDRAPCPPWPCRDAWPGAPACSPRA